MDKETKNMFEAKALLKAQRTLLTFPEKTYNQFTISIGWVLQLLQLLLLAFS
jgi:hypothetical protein